MIDLTRLQAFLYAAEDLNFSEAAKRMNVTQPTISHHIKILEQTLGVQLFERSGSSIKLTEAGRILLPWAHKLLSDAVEMQQMMQSLDEHIVGEIRIACSTTTGKYVLPQFAARFREQHPGVTVNILSCGKESVIPHVLKEDADLGVVSYDACGEEVECQQFFIDHIVLIVPIEHPWAERQYIEPTELLETPFIIREPESGTRRVLLAELGKHDISLDDLRIFMQLGNTEAIVKTVEAGYAVSFVSHLAAAWALDLGRVTVVPVTGFDLRRKIYMIRNEIHMANRAADAFWGFVHNPSNADLLRLAET